MSPANLVSQCLLFIIAQAVVRNYPYVDRSHGIVRLETIIEERGRKVMDERLGQLVKERLRQALASDPAD